MGHQLMSDRPWESWIGTTTSAAAYLDPAQANRMAATLDRTPSFTSGDVLPPAWHWLYFHEVVEASRLGRDGHPELGVTMPELPLPRRMWAGGSLAFVDPIRLGATAVRRSTITGIVPKKGRTGSMYFVTLEHDVRVDDVVKLRESQTIVYRDLAAEATADPPQAPTGGTFGRDWTVDSTALFRYSALTFNGHRIHYDADYARTVEGYPGLVVHGPLLATLLMDAATDHGGPLASFSYRARSPLFVSEAFTVQGRRTHAHEGADVEVWAASADGRLAMSGTALFEPTKGE